MAARPQSTTAPQHITALRRAVTTGLDKYAVAYIMTLMERVGRNVKT